jgi:hypothetical protein
VENREIMENKKFNKYDLVLEILSGGDQERQILSVPNEIDGVVTATDTRVLAVFNKSLLASGYESNENYPAAMKLFKEARVINRYRKTVSIDSLIGYYAESSFKMKRKIKECNECDGEGKSYCDCCDNESSCGECDGEGSEDDGPLEYSILETNEYGVVKINNIRFGSNVLYKFIQSCCLIGVKEVEMNYSEKGKAVIFTLHEGCEILVMPLRSQQYEK